MTILFVCLLCLCARACLPVRVCLCVIQRERERERELKVVSGFFGIIKSRDVFVQGENIAVDKNLMESTKVVTDAEKFFFSERSQTKPNQNNKETFLGENSRHILCRLFLNSNILIL